MALGKSDSIILYGTPWCGDTIRTRNFFDNNKIAYHWIDINQDAEARKFVEQTNHGNRSVPTIVFPDGSILVEPSLLELKEKIGL
jgi:glutaredoxin-like protein